MITYIATIEVTSVFKVEIEATNEDQAYEIAETMLLEDLLEEGDLQVERSKVRSAEIGET